MPKTARLNITSRRAAPPTGKPSREKSPIELLWRRHEAAVSEKVRAYGLQDDNDVDADDAAMEAASDAAYNAVEDIDDEIIAAEMTSVTDVAIKARVLKRHGDVESVGYYRAEDILKFFDELQVFALRQTFSPR